MGKSKTEKKANGVKPVTSTVKEGRVAKASQTPVAKAKEAVKAAVIKSDKKGKSKKKAKEPTPQPDTSNSDTDADSESSVSSDDEEAAKPAPKSSVKTNGAVKPAAADSETSDSSSSESDDEAPAVEPKANGVNGAPKKAVGAKDLTSDSSESDSDSESESEAETPAIKAAAKVATDSSSDSDDSSADSSESESESETEAPAKVNGTAIKAAVSDSSDNSDSGSGSDSEGSDSEEEEDAKAVAEAPSKKRKADTETTPAAKKAKPDVNGFNDKRASKNLFVGNIAWGVDEDALAKEFEEYGDIVGCRIMTDRDSGRSKGFGYVEFETVEMAVQAYNGKQGAELGGRTLNVDYSEPRPQRDNNASYSNDRASRHGDKKSEPSDTVFLGNLSFDANNDMISEMFQQFGEITRVSLPTDRESGQLKGFGYVGFSSVDEATAAIAELQGADVAGRPIRLDFAGPRPENNDSPRGGRGGFGGRGGGRGGGGRGGGGFGGRGGGRGRGGDRGFGGRGGGRGGRGGSFQSTNRGGFGDFKGKKVSFD